MDMFGKRPDSQNAASMPGIDRLDDPSVLENQVLITSFVTTLKNPNASDAARDEAQVTLTARLGERFVQGCLMRAYTDTLPNGSSRSALEILSRSFGDARTDLALHKNVTVLDSIRGLPVERARANSLRAIEPGLESGTGTFGFIIDTLRAITR